MGGEPIMKHDVYNPHPSVSHDLACKGTAIRRVLNVTPKVSLLPWLDKTGNHAKYCNRLFIGYRIVDIFILKVRKKIMPVDNMDMRRKMYPIPLLK